MKQVSIQKFFFLLVLLFMVAPLFSQDTIVTNTKDTILCKITKITKDELFFKLTHQNETRRMKLPMTAVVEYKVNSNTTYSANVPLFYKYRLAFDGGCGYRSSPYAKGISDEERARLSVLRKGALFGVEMTYYPYYKLGFGLKYSYMSTLEAPIYVNYLAAKADYRLTSDNQKHFLHIYGSGGYLSYIEHLSQDGVARITAGTLGLSCGIGYDFLATNRIAIGLDLSYILGGFSSINVTNGLSSAVIDLKENAEGLNRIDFSIGIRFIR